VIKSRMATGEVLAPNAPGRDPIVSRVLWLRGKESQNANARERCIYIHGTAEESRIGKRASFGCVRMRSKDVIALYSRVHIGTQVTISDKRIAALLPEEEPTLLARQD
jgi:lipoprotein-anchoring transpeptidase ErfK/SrfK